MEPTNQNRKGMQGRLLTMMESGDAYMQMEQMVAARPQKSLRPCP
jgi:hypothetical protein